VSTAQKTGNKTTNNKALFTGFHDAMNAGDAEAIASAIDELVDPDVLIHQRLPVQTTGTQALKDTFGMLLRAFPDLHVTVEDLIEEADKVVGRNSVTGTHRGEYLGLQPTGRPVAYDEIFIFRFADGRIVEMWGVVDVLAQMRQLGAAPGGR
jgi:predicted ester cyclase